MRKDPIPTSPTHITYRLYGSIPNLGLSKLHDSHRLQRARLEAQFTRDQRSTDATVRREYRRLVEQAELTHFRAYDDMLDHATRGPRFLDSPEAKRIVIDSWKYIAKQHGLIIYAISVMSNHVHVLLENQSRTLIPLATIMTDHKRYTATELNRLHGTKGRRVWAEKEYSRTVRYGRFEQTLWYVLNNPVKAGLTDDAAAWYGNYYPESVRHNFVEVRKLAG